MDEYNINEEIREKIRQMIEDAKLETGLGWPDEFDFILTSICFTMYKNGMNDGFKLSTKSIETLKNNMSR